jgi:hypothetical protein
MTSRFIKSSQGMMMPFRTYVGLVAVFKTEFGALRKTFISQSVRVLVKFDVTFKKCCPG